MMKRIIASILPFLFPVLFASAQNKAIVSVAVNYMRENPDYTAELGDQALMGTVVELFDTSSYWVKIRTQEPYTAWVNDITLVPVSESELQAYLSAPKLIVKSDYSHVYSKPSEKSTRLSDLVWQDVLRTDGVGTKKKWSHVILPDGRDGWVMSKDVISYDKWLAKAGAMSVEKRREWVVSQAMRMLGVTYFWGGTSIKGVDCSGLTSLVYRSCGVLLPRNASQQARLGVEVSLEDALPGDLVFFGREATDTAPERITHVAMYIGDGRIVHSSKVIRINSLRPGDEDYYDRKPLHIRSIAESVDISDYFVYLHN